MVYKNVKDLNHFGHCTCSPGSKQWAHMKFFFLASLSLKQNNQNFASNFKITDRVKGKVLSYDWECFQIYLAMDSFNVLFKENTDALRWGLGVFNSISNGKDADTVMKRLYTCCFVCNSFDVCLTFRFTKHKLSAWVNILIQ